MVVFLVLAAASLQTAKLGTFGGPRCTAVPIKYANLKS